MAPGTSWCLSLEDVVWEGEQAGALVRLHDEPGSGFWSDLGLTLLGWLPIEGQL